MFCYRATCRCFLSDHVTSFIDGTHFRGECLGDRQVEGGHVKEKGTYQLALAVSHPEIVGAREAKSQRSPGSMLIVISVTHQTRPHQVLPLRLVG